MIGGRRLRRQGRSGVALPYGDDNALDATLQEEKKTDAALTQIAETVVNQEAG
jgi:ferritin-like metal-binding protein YciE